jgi:hypothetical protein
MDDGVATMVNAMSRSGAMRIMALIVAMLTPLMVAAGGDVTVTRLEDNERLLTISNASGQVATIGQYRYAVVVGFPVGRDESSPAVGAVTKLYLRLGPDLNQGSCGEGGFELVDVAHATTTWRGRLMNTFRGSGSGSHSTSLLTCECQAELTKVGTSEALDVRVTLSGIPLAASPSVAGRFDEKFFDSFPSLEHWRGDIEAALR